MHARICISGARGAYFGPGLALDAQRNIVATVVIAFDRPFALRILDDGAWHDAWVALVPPGTLHHVRPTGLVGFVYLDPLSDDHRHLAATDLRTARIRDAVERGTATIGSVCAALGIPARTIDDARIRRVVAAIEATPDDFPTIEAAAARVDLSPARFRTLFNQHVGLPFRRYRLWRRMAGVMYALKDGRTLTEAAHRAGFSSSAHLSTAFRDMFGLTPSALLDTGVQLDVTEDHDLAMAAT